MQQPQKWSYHSSNSFRPLPGKGDEALLKVFRRPDAGNPGDRGLGLQHAKKAGMPVPGLHYCIYLGSGFAWNWSCKLVIFLPYFILTWSFLTLFAERICPQPLVPLSWLRDRLKVGLRLLAVSSVMFSCVLLQLFE